MRWYFKKIGGQQINFKNFEGKNKYFRDQGCKIQSSIHMNNRKIHIHVTESWKAHAAIEEPIDVWSNWATCWPNEKVQVKQCSDRSYRLYSYHPVDGFPTVETTDGVPIEKSCHGEWVHRAMHCPTGVPCVTCKNIRGDIWVGVMMGLMCMCKVNECVRMSMCMDTCTIMCMCTRMCNGLIYNSHVTVTKWEWEEEGVTLVSHSLTFVHMHTNVSSLHNYTHCTYTTTTL